jgi:hypothetical protein
MTSKKSFFQYPVYGSEGRLPMEFTLGNYKMEHSVLLPEKFLRIELSSYRKKMTICLNRVLYF